jgi:Zn finger protein HypA/HybF involved in hydrogenase expression
MGRSITQDEFIQRCHVMHGERYDYTPTVYAKMTLKVSIICPIHGEFSQKAASHLRGYGCPTCGGCQRMGGETFICRARDLYGDRFEYDQVRYTNCLTEVKVTCRRHGDFLIKPVSMLHWNLACPACRQEAIAQGARGRADIRPGV